MTLTKVSCLLFVLCMTQVCPVTSNEVTQTAEEAVGTQDAVLATSKHYGEKYGKDYGDKFAKKYARKYAKHFVKEHEEEESHEECPEPEECPECPEYTPPPIAYFVPTCQPGVPAGDDSTIDCVSCADATEVYGVCPVDDPYCVVDNSVAEPNYIISQITAGDAVRVDDAAECFKAAQYFGFGAIQDDRGSFSTNESESSPSGCRTAAYKLWSEPVRLTNFYFNYLVDSPYLSTYGDGISAYTYENSPICTLASLTTTTPVKK